MPGVGVKAGRRGTLPRVSSPAGVKARQARRLRTFQPEIPKGGPGTQRHHKPGSGNPRKVGR